MEGPNQRGGGGARIMLQTFDKSDHGLNIGHQGQVADS